jgi:hypothetical protein
VHRSHSQNQALLLLLLLVVVLVDDLLPARLSLLLVRPSSLSVAVLLAAAVAAVAAAAGAGAAAAAAVAAAAAAVAAAVAAAAAGAAVVAAVTLLLAQTAPQTAPQTAVAQPGRHGLCVVSSLPLSDTAHTLQHKGSVCTSVAAPVCHRGTHHTSDTLPLQLGALLLPVR